MTSVSSYSNWEYLQHRRSRRFIYATAAVMSIAFGATNAFIPILHKAVGWSDRAVAMGGACFSFGVVFGALIMGMTARPQRHTLVLPLLVFAGAVALMAVSRPLPLLLLRFGEGFGLGAALVASETMLLLRVPPTARAFAMSLYAVCGAVGFALGPIMAAPMVEPVGNRWPLLVPFCGAMVASVLAMFVISSREHSKNMEKTSYNLERTLAIWRKTVIPCTTTFLFGAYQTAVTLLLPLHLLARNVGAEAAMLTFAAFATGLLVFSLPLARLGDRYGYARVMIGQCLVGGVASIFFGLLHPTILVRWGLVFVVGGSLATLSPLSLGLQAQMNRTEDLAMANGIYNGHYAVGMLVGPWLVALLLPSLGTATMLVGLGMVWLAHACFIWFKRKTVVLCSDH